MNRRLLLAGLAVTPLGGCGWFWGDSISDAMGEALDFTVHDIFVRQDYPREVEGGVPFAVEIYHETDTQDYSGNEKVTYEVTYYLPGHAPHNGGTVRAAAKKLPNNQVELVMPVNYVQQRISDLREPVVLEMERMEFEVHMMFEGNLQGSTPRYPISVYLRQA